MGISPEHGNQSTNGNSTNRSSPNLPDQLSPRNPPVEHALVHRRQLRIQGVGCSNCNCQRHVPLCSLLHRFDQTITSPAWWDVKGIIWKRGNFCCSSPSWICPETFDLYCKPSSRSDTFQSIFSSHETARFFVKTMGCRKKEVNGD